EQFHAGHDIEAAGRSFLQFFGGNQLVSNGQPALEQVQLRDPEGFFRKVDAGHIGAEARHRLAQDSAAAADVEHALAGEMRQAVDPAQAQWIELVQRPEFALRVPPAVRELAEFRELGRVCVLFHGCHKQKAPPQRGFSRAARLAYLRVPMTSISTRRFFWRPSFVLLLATGCFSPLPSVYTRFGSMPFDTRYALTASARRTDSFWLYTSEPIESVWPIAITTSRLTSFTLPARSSSFDLPSGLMVALSKSNSTSAANVIFSATGFGFATGAGG